MSAPKYRYQPEGKVPGMKGSQHTCPGCGKSRQFTRWVDTRTGELLPEEYGRCNNTDRCGYDLSPYSKEAAETSYADEVREHEQMPKEWFTVTGKSKRNKISRSSALSQLMAMTEATHEQAEAVVSYVYDQPDRNRKTPGPATPPPAKVYTIPDDIFSRSLANYERNNFARLLAVHFGLTVAQDLLQRFQIGTSAHWPGSSVFWILDEPNRARGGQVVLFADDGHTAKYDAADGERKRCTSWVHTALLQAHQKRGQAAPDWLTEYNADAPKFPILFGLQQLQTAPADQPLAIVEAPATAVFCSGYFPAFIWLAVGALDWLTVERLASVKGRKVRLFPDLSKTGKAFQKWTAAAERLRAAGFSVEVDTLLEEQASQQEREGSYDIRDYLLEQWPGYPPSWDTGLVSQNHSNQF